MSFIDKIPDDKIRDFATEQYNKVKKHEETISTLQSTITQLQKDLGEIDEFKDTPSLNLILFDEEGHPHCEEHGAMNQYENRIYRCVGCGVAVNLDGFQVVSVNSEDEEIKVIGSWRYRILKRDSQKLDTIRRLMSP